PPSFDSQEYWNDRFTSNPNPFEWLGSSDALDPYLTTALRNISDLEQPEILHIGCGTSLLSYHLRKYVRNSEQVHNVDYSEVAIEIGKKKEAEMFAITGNDTANSSTMRWSSINLLDHSSLLQAFQPSTYSIVVEKSTSDSISCADDVDVPLPYHIITSSNASFVSGQEQVSKLVHPLHILAVHLALVTKPGGRWIALSYSMDRYPFLDSSASDTIADDSELPNPSRLWKLVGKFEMEPEIQISGADASQAHKPKVLHWVYVLERTNVEL
ncbi:hypothetical protein DM02DRAFT_470671, partial [Periconia macrospinosa]